MDMRAVRRRCERLAARIGVPSPFDVHVFVHRVAQMRGRPIELAAMSTGVASPCGLWIATDTIDLIFYEDGTSAPHQRHIVVHELGHLCFEHQGQATAEQQDLTHQFPDLDPALVRRVLARTTVTADEEREAEMFATVVLDSGWQRHPPSLSRQPTSEPERQRLERLADTLERPDDPPP